MKRVAFLYILEQSNNIYMYIDFFINLSVIQSNWTLTFFAVTELIM